LPLSVGLLKPERLSKWPLPEKPVVLS